jgi:hypothetical protein
MENYLNNAEAQKGVNERQLKWTLPGWLKITFRQKINQYHAVTANVNWPGVNGFILQ